MRTDGRMILFMIYPLCKVSSLINDKLLSAKKISRKTFYIQLSSVVLTNNSTRYDKMKIHIFKNLLCNIWISCCFHHLLVLADTRRGFQSEQQQQMFLKFASLNVYSMYMVVIISAVFSYESISNYREILLFSSINLAPLNSSELWISLQKKYVVLRLFQSHIEIVTPKI